MQKKDTKKPIRFEAITNPSELITYLDANVRLKDSKFLYQYTSISALISMIRNKTMHLGNAKYMNDQLEYENGDAKVWSNLFFSCFMMEEDENIGMWSMYAQPWRDGVKIAIPKEVLRQWVSEVHEITVISQETKQATGQIIDNPDKFRIWISAVAYSNYDGISSEADELLRIGGQENHFLHNAPHIPELTGYIKDMAWSYEKEVRVKVQFNNDVEFERVAINMPDYVIDSLIITPSPLFEGNIKDRIYKEISRQMTTEKSKFVGKLNIRSACDRCSLMHIG